MPARGTATNRQVASNRQPAVGRSAASGRLNVDGSGGGGGGADDMTFLDETVVGGGGAASVTFSAISGAYRHLMIFWCGRCDNASPQDLQVQFNGDTAGNYDREYTQYNNANTTFAGSAAASFIALGRVPGTGAPAGAMASGVMTIQYYSTTTQDKIMLNSQFGADGTAVGDMFLNQPGGGWRTSNAAITSIVFTLSAGSFIQNTRFSLYGIT